MWRLWRRIKVPISHISAVTTAKAFLSSVGCVGLFSLDRERSGRVYLWGDRSALPGGSNHPLFGDARRWHCITFGPSFGAAVDKLGAVYIWGQSPNGHFVEPFTAGATGVVDCWCSATDVYMLMGTGEVCVYRDIPAALTKLSDGENGGSTTSTRDVNRAVSHDETSTHPTDTTRITTNFKPTIDHIAGLRGKRIVKMSVGIAHAAFIASDGKLYCTGDNSFGQCGTKPANLRNSNTLLTFPSSNEEANDTVDLHRVEFKDPNTKIVDVVCGGRHTCCLDSNGNVYTFGDDSGVQLFLGDTRGRTILELDQYRAFSRRQDHSSRACTKYTHKDKHLQFNPIPVNVVGKLRDFKDDMDGATISLAAGDDFTIVGVTADAERHVYFTFMDIMKGSSQLIASGGNRFGQCGSVDVRMLRPKTVSLPGQLAVKGLVCGSNHCLAALEGGSLLGWGSNQQHQLGFEKRGNITTPTPIVQLGEHAGGPPTDTPMAQIQFVRCAFNNTAVITT